jgi:hypothetical protein
LAQQSDGSILLGGLSNAGRLVVDKFSANGLLGTRLAIVSGTDASDSTSVSIGLQSDGKIVLGSTIGNGIVDDFGVVRLNGDGSLDSTFGTGGVVTTDLVGGSKDLVGGMVIDGSDQIVLAGRAVYSSQNHVALVRYGNAPGPVTVNATPINVQVNNVAPTVSITGDSTGVRGQPRTETITVSDPSSVDTASASSLVTINWGDSSTPTTMTFGQFAAGPVAKQHAYAANGTYTMTVAPWRPRVSPSRACWSKATSWRSVDTPLTMSRSSSIPAAGRA